MLSRSWQLRFYQESNSTLLCTCRSNLLGRKNLLRDGRLCREGGTTIPSASRVRDQLFLSGYPQPARLTNPVDRSIRSAENHFDCQHAVDIDWFLAFVEAITRDSRIHRNSKELGYFFVR